MNVVLAGWEDVYFSATLPSEQRWLKLAVLETPLVQAGQTWYSVGEFGRPGFHQKFLTKARLLGWVNDTIILFLGVATTPFPWGFTVEPDHP